MATNKKILDRFLECLVMVSVTVLVLDVLWQVFTRFVLRDASSWTEELATFLLIWVSLLGAAVAWVEAPTWASTTSSPNCLRRTASKRNSLPSPA